MQLVAYGAQDIYLTGNPQISFFKIVYRRHTNFSMETIKQSFDGSAIVPTNNNINQAYITISREGDLIYKMYAVVDDDNSLINNGSQIIKEATLEIGGQMIDKHYQEWNEIWNELSTSESKAVGLKSMQGCIGVSGESGASMVQIPLNFWFCRNAGLALPLIALQYHEVKIHLDISNGGNTEEKTLKFFVDYIYLDTEERRRFAQNSHEYLIEQIQRQPISNSKSQTLVLNHPVKELIWTNVRGNDYGSAKLKLNGQDRFSYQKKDYFQLRQPYDYHTSVPKQNLPFLANCMKNNSGLILGNFRNSTDVSSIGSGFIYFNESISPPEILISSSDATSWVSSIKKGDILKISINLEGLIEHESNNKMKNRYDDATETELPEGATFYSEIKDITNNKITFISPFYSVTGNKIIKSIKTSVGGVFSVTFKISKLSNIIESKTSKMTKQINVYSFALKPEEHQPSGTCNFSRIDTAQLNTYNSLNVEDGYIYAVNYNVLRIMSGMGGLAYSN